MDILKKNLLSVICGVVAIICIILLFIPFGGMYDTLVQDVQKSKSTGDKIRNVLNQQRQWPSLSSREEDRIALAEFPTPAIISRGENMTKNWTNQAKLFLDSAVELQRQQLKVLAPGVLPTGGGSAATNRFIEEYQRKFGIWVNPNNGERDLSGSLFTQILRSAVPPDQMEIKAEQDRIATDIRSRRTIINQGVVQNEAEVVAAINEAMVGVADHLRGKAAREALIYADPATCFDVNPKIAINQPLTPSDLFIAQAKLWVEEELCKAITETNLAANPKDGVLSTPIKRLVRMQVFTSYFAARPQPGVAPSSEPLAAPVNASIKLAPNFAKNPLGHQSNEFYDVINFELTLICDGATLPESLVGLTRNRYTMIQQVQVQSVDSAVDAAGGFLYGSRPVIRVVLRGQYLLLRQFAAALMPPDIIRGLTLPPESQQTPMYDGPMMEPGMPGFPGYPGGPGFPGGPGSAPGPDFPVAR